MDPNTEPLGHLVSYPVEELVQFTRLQRRQRKRLRRIQINGLQVLLHTIRVLQNQRLSVADWLSELVNILPFAWQYPEISAARIQLGGAEFTSNNFEKTAWIQSAKFRLGNTEDGVIEIVYLKERPEDYEGPFLREERAFIDSVAEMLSSAIDRRDVEDALRQKEAALRSSNEYSRDLAGRLIQAQEAERSRIARELHDSVNQQIAAVSISLSNIRRRLSAPAGEISQDLGLLQKKIFEIGDEIRRVSHELHPAILQHAGLSGAIRSACSQFSDQHSIAIELNIAGNVDSVPMNLAVCIYRVIQEAFHNIGSHAKATRVNLILNQESGCLNLMIADNGQGFRLEDATKQGGLGLISMDERVRIFHGTLKIDTRLHRGTSLQLMIPRTDP